ncbi:hypothetical protein J437_LFUL017532, partial [Ladona fulva]
FWSGCCTLEPGIPFIWAYVRGKAEEFAVVLVILILRCQMGNWRAANAGTILHVIVYLARGKEPKEYFTLLCNMPGELVIPTVVRKSARPRCFKNLDIRNILVTWEISKCA